MGNIISRYEEKKAELHDRIRDGSIDVTVAEESNPVGYTCYFCMKHIEGDALVFTDRQKVKGYDAESRYYLHNQCYNSAKAAEKEAQVDITFCLN